MKIYICILALASLVACQGDEGTPVDYGIAIPQSSVDDALNAPLAGVDPLNIQAGQFVDVLQSEIIEGQAYKATGEVGTTVVSREDQDTQVVFTIIEKTVNYNDGTTITKELTRTAAKNSATDPVATPTPAPTASPVPSPSPAAAIADVARNIIARVQALRPGESFANPVNLMMNVAAADPTANPPTTFHNLTVQVSSEAPPTAVQQQSNCGGIPKCKISVHKITFDMLVWDTPTTPDKIHREFSISGDVPFFANVMSQCDSLMVPNGTTKTLVTLCSDVTNFRFTTP